ncbi:phosphoadenosine phosphosulfate reductase family protein, partial [Isoptericola sp. NPDC060282]|uniref:phosphoadenosine phosphosulfate reductase domain-containing protein n=1 Tax=Isoptericola sp. NPDC060282 TaxID=3347093 RepID=UPI00365CF02B
MTSHVLSQLRSLEAESIHIIREVVAEMQRPCLLFSGGKDSIVMLHLAAKAFAPARIPFPIMHVDTGLNFPSVLATRDRWVERLGIQLVVGGGEGAHHPGGGEGGAHRAPHPHPNPGGGGGAARKGVGPQ